MATNDPDIARCVKAWVDETPAETVPDWCGFIAIGVFVARYLPTPPPPFPRGRAARRGLARAALIEFNSRQRAGIV